MKISTKGRYGLRAVVDLAVYSEKTPVSLSSISKRQNISVSYLEQLIPKLRRAGIVESVRGANGGYRLCISPAEISIGAILRALEGEIRTVDCPKEPGEETHCISSNRCVTKFVWEKINDSINDTIDHIFLSELAEKAKQTMPEETQKI